MNNNDLIDRSRRVGFEEKKGRDEERPAAGFRFTLLLRNSRKSTIFSELIGLAFEKRQRRVGACENIGTAGKRACIVCIWTCKIRTIKLRRIACTFREYSRKRIIGQGNRPIAYPRRNCTCQLIVIKVPAKKSKIIE